MNKRIAVLGLATVGGVLLLSTAFADINRVRVVNNTKSSVYIHKGGYAPSVKVLAGRWKIFYYPFQAIDPSTKRKAASSLLVATSGGRWLTTPNGYTYLSKPNMIICLDYRRPEHTHKTGNRVWTIKRAQGFDKNCKVRGYRQLWFQKSKQ